MSTMDMGASYQQSGQQQATEQKLSSIMDSLKDRRSECVTARVLRNKLFLAG